MEISLLVESSGSYYDSSQSHENSVDVVRAGEALAAVSWQNSASVAQPPPPRPPVYAAVQGPSSGPVLCCVSIRLQLDVTLTALLFPFILAFFSADDSCYLKVPLAMMNFNIAITVDHYDVPLHLFIAFSGS